MQSFSHSFLQLHLKLYFNICGENFYSCKCYLPDRCQKAEDIGSKNCCAKTEQEREGKDSKKEGSTFRGKVLNSFVWVYGTEKTYRKLVYCTTISVCHYENMNSIRQISNCRITYGGGLGMTPCIMGLTTQDPYILFKFIKCSARKIITRCLAQFS